MNNEQIIQELQSSFDSDYGVSQQLIDNVARLIHENEKLRAELEQEKEKNKELEKQINFNKKIVEIAKTQILEYSQGYKDGLNKETTATAIVARELELNFIRQEIKHKYISKDKIREKIEEIKNYTYTSKEERQCQNYGIDRLKELMEVDNE